VTPLAQAASSTSHLGHAVVGGAALLLAVAVLLVLRSRARRGTVPVSRPAVADSRTGWLAVAVIGAAAVHGGVIRGHLEESPWLGAFFLVLLLAQAAYAVAVVLRPTRPVLLAGLVGNAAVIALWGYTRLLSVPFGLGDAPGPEAAGAADLLSVAFELVADLLAALLLRHPGLHRGTLTPAQRIAAVLAVALTGAVLGTTGSS